jgi:hypothetical protein
MAKSNDCIDKVLRALYPDTSAELRKDVYLVIVHCCIYCTICSSSCKSFTLARPSLFQHLRRQLHQPYLQRAFVLGVEPEDRVLCVNEAPSKMDAQLSLAYPSKSAEGHHVLMVWTWGQPDREHLPTTTNIRES